jgi:hypothetical protein
VGNEVFLDRDESDAKAQEYRKLIVPPFMSKSKNKYNSVKGKTGGSDVWIVCE